MTDNYPQFFSISLVKAPKCEECGEHMKAMSKTQWACINDDCFRCAIKVDGGKLGVFPVWEDPGERKA